MDVAAEVCRLQQAVARLEAALAARDDEIALKDGALIVQAQRIAELERALEEQRRGGKRQAAPFSKGKPEANPKRPGRRRGDAHGRHGHRAAPLGPPDREFDAGLPGCCPACGGKVIADRVEEQWQVDIPPVIAPTVTKFNVAVELQTRLHEAAHRRVRHRRPPHRGRRLQHPDLE